ncbi:MAG: hypothetical protein GXO27_06665 [Chlorobi bacterium]|nr:hypothetical protein [Chlorobiota bacterium]
MSFWDKIFGHSDREHSGDEPREPVPATPEERFVKKFTDNKGKFLLARSEEDIRRHLADILRHEGAAGYWAPADDVRSALLKDLPRSGDPQPPPGHIFTGFARYLIEKDGGILFTSYETGEFRLIDLPDTMVFIATPDRLIPDKETAMENINRNMRNAYPSHIHSIHRFSDEKNEFSKNVYLILYV